MKYALFVGGLALCFSANAQKINGYQFTEVKRAAETPVKNQQNTGTCWSFSSTSFLESEILRTKNEVVDLSEMYIVRNIYFEKAQNYILRQGHAQFGQGALAHDLLGSVAKYGAVPESVYPGRAEGSKHDHTEIEAVLKGLCDVYIKSGVLSDHWKNTVNAVLDEYFGKLPTTFTYKSKQYTPASFAAAYGINNLNIVHLTSFTHHPFYAPFVLEVPDNFSNGSFQNLPLDEFMKVLTYALENGYTVTWDCDVSNKGFNAGKGIAIQPQKAFADMSKAEMDSAFTNPVAQLPITQEYRQKLFENLTTQDDHLMQITGMVKDQNGNLYFIVKNSWGEISDLKGHVYASESYVKLNSISISLPRAAIPAEIAGKLKL